ncbi:MAG: zinc-ribbon and DUF3426 domain-containing protein [Gammaproteobacteria bacterium]|nr:zinc-ribbon and DUF3426 domain-containing protein [Gammaproteobacteria bacterium]MDH3805104.1 zinc-ribbon and DUF3426 domain-containing protein [Gammaproteobacteria bacterium]
MYTQCPECGVAFRVTAEVLKQATGQVRCGGCGVAFNALAHLSEKEPAAPVQSEPASERKMPELTADVPDEPEAGTAPKSISAEKSAALLKTLDQLAGSDIRIEDTGVEWRVLDDDDVIETEVSPEEAAQADELLEKSFAPVDEEITESPNDAEAPESVEEMRFDDNTPLPDDFDFENKPPAPAEPTPAREPELARDPAESQVDLAFGDPDEWQDLLGDLDEAAVVEDEEQPEEPPEELVAAAEEPAQVEEVARDQPLDMDTQFAIQAEAMGIDLSGIHRAVDKDQVDDEADEAATDDEDRETTIDEDLIAAAFETEAAAQPKEIAADELELEELEEKGLSEEQDEAEEEEIELELDEKIEPVDEVEREDDVDDIASVFDDKVEKAIETIAAGLDDEPRVEEEPDIEDASDGHMVPEMSEEERTINMMIDKELFNIAVEDEDGFASTIVQLQPSKKVEKEFDAFKAPKKPRKLPLFETIIMEGDVVHADDDKAAKSRRFDDPGFSFPLKKTSSYETRGDRRWTDPPSWRTIGGIIVLLILLAVQMMHQSREALATMPVFNQAVGPLYRMLGKPLTPRWDISGWRFEATKGSTDENDKLLTIYSRVGNESDKALPYPLVHLSLTDRFEEIIGSRVLEPGEYLAENADPRNAVPPGNTFNAVISIASPAAEATGFKLNVCYRLANGQLRCAIEDFK